MQKFERGSYLIKNVLQNCFIFEKFDYMESRVQNKYLIIVIIYYYSILLVTVSNLQLSVRAATRTQ